MGRIVLGKSITLICAAMALMFALCLAGCGGESAGSGGLPSEGGIATEGPSASPDAGIDVAAQGETDLDGASSDRVNPDGAGLGVLCREDEEGLISIYIFEDGHAYLFFNMEQWEKMHAISKNPYFTQDWLKEGPFAIVTANGGRIQDVCIGKIESFGYESLTDFVTPTVILLMEDGSLEYLMPANPHAGAYSFDDAFFSHGKLPWLNDIASLSYEEGSEGIGEKTIFATDSGGLVYDVRLVCHMFGIFEEEWRYLHGEDGSAETRHGTLRFFEGGNTVWFTAGWSEGGDTWELNSYEFDYTIHLAENAPDHQRPGIIDFHLSRIHDGWDDARYFIFAGDAMTLELLHSDGGHLAYGEGGEPITYFFFYRPSEAGDYNGNEPHYP